MTPQEQALASESSLAKIGEQWLASFGRAIQLTGLYRSTHPMSAEALREAYHLLERAFAACRQEELHLSLVDGRWLFNEAPVLAEDQAPEPLRNLFRRHGLRSLSFARELRPFELAALCEIASLPAHQVERGALDDFFVQRGVKHIRHDQERYARASEHPIAPPKPHPASTTSEKSAPPKPTLAPAPSPSASPSLANFTSLLKALVESAVKDPDERVHLYEDTTRLVTEAMDHHVAQATAALTAEKTRILGEQARTEKVLTTVAEGQVIVDREGKVLMMNPAAEELAGKSLSEMVGKHIQESIKPGEQMVAMAQDLSRTPGAASQVDVVADDDVGRALRRSMAVVQDDTGRVVGTYAALPDVAKYKETLRLQEEFLSRVTHDLQAPLSSISCALELLDERLGGKMGTDEAGFLSVCVKNSQQLGSMIRDILDFSRLQAGKMTIRPVATSMAAILKEAVESLQPWAKNKGINLACQIPDPDMTVMADSRRVVQVLANLISNAIKFTPEGGHIVVGVAPRVDAQGHVVCGVRDTGCGIPPESLQKVFEKFERAGNHDGVQPGVGLGLSIVKELVGLHGGQVWAQSEVGKGSTFYFTLPAAANSDAPADSADAG